MRMICASLFFCQIVVTASCFGDDEPASSDIIERIHAVWRQRASEFRSIELTWNREAILDGKAVDEREMRLGRWPNILPPAPAPPNVKEYQLSQQHRLVISGDYLSWRAQGTGLRGQRSGDLRLIDHKWVFDGKCLTHLWNVDDLNPLRDFQADLYADTEPIVSNGNLFPILLNVRPMDASRRRFFDVTAFKPAPETSQISGYECICLKLNDNAIWVAPGANYSTLRLTFGTRHETTIEVAKTAAGSFVPSKWVHVRKDANGKVSDSTECSVTNVKVNGDVPLGEFRIELPKNTLILDERPKPKPKSEPKRLLTARAFVE